MKEDNVNSILSNIEEDEGHIDSTKIPKVIHYIWLGTRSLDKTSMKCMKTWRQYLPDYKIRKWDDERCRDIINSNKYAKQAYESKKYAFVSDYLRVYILYHFGGVYMDTDVQVVKSINQFLDEDAFTCFENKTHIPTALMASTKGNAWMGALLKDYDDRLFLKEDGTMDFTTNVDAITRVSMDWGFIPNGEEQILRSGVHIYTKDYFCPLDTMDSSKDIITENTYAMHLYNGSWRSPLRQKLSKIKKKLGIDPDKIFCGKFAELLRKV